MPRSVLVTAVVAALVTAGALGGAVVLRPGAQPNDARPPDGAPTRAVDARCPPESCQVLASTEVAGTVVALLADSDGGSGRVRFGGQARGLVVETMVTTMGARLTGDSLRCAEGARPVCLVRGAVDGGAVGEVLVSAGTGEGTWRAAERLYFSDAGYLSLDDVTGDGVAEVVVVRHDCAPDAAPARCRVAPVVAQVFDLGGTEVGCTRRHTAPSGLRGWPEVEVRRSDLRDCR
ncbi:hypothetical protein SAMN05421810_105210 [Amycolatopsis arida]|uniref:Uncharacterized protein n=1 Tax=Amycolatopsis arida TaxID=587909 RepID=A0A1I5WQL0_9PSEU|nr:hypothetical protein CLV69_105229 [Amycolatopsis arida]SFQ21666.1 hypothetical protein SAMN05421810_105210 [Amycolatopsis arida]